MLNAPATSLYVYAVNCISCTLRGGRWETFSFFKRGEVSLSPFALAEDVVSTLEDEGIIRKGSFNNVNIERNRSERYHEDSITIRGKEDDRPFLKLERIFNR